MGYVHRDSSTNFHHKIQPRTLPLFLDANDNSLMLAASSIQSKWHRLSQPNVCSVWGDRVREMATATGSPHTHLSSAGCMHRYDAPIPHIEHVACVLQLVLTGDGDDGVALATNEGSKLNALPAASRVGGSSIIRYQPYHMVGRQVVRQVVTK